MSFFDEEKPDAQNPEQNPEQRHEQAPVIRAQENTNPQVPATPQPANEYWVRNGNNQGQTTPNGYGQGYQQQPYQPSAQGQYPPPYQNRGGYQGGYQPQQPQQYRPSQYQYGSNSGWQQPPARQPESYQWNFQDYDKAAGARTKRKRNRGLVVFVVALVSVLAIGLISISAYGVFNYINSDSTDSSVRTAPSEQSVSGGAQIEIASKPQISETLPIGGKMTIPQVAKAVSPSVVGVIQYRPTMYLEETGAGSGIVMSADGYVITNAHVVEGGEAFKVILADGSPRDAELVGSDKQTDLAVLKVSGVTNLTPAAFGDSDNLEVGELVLAIGNPAGTELAGSVTQGIISAVKREIPAAANMPLIQTDAAINPGNSGGALVNEYGQVIGINSAKIVAQGFEGIGFAIPITEAKPIIDDIVSNGRVTGRVKLGIQAREIDEIDARSTGLKEGIRIEVIEPDSDLLNQNVQKFDIITHVEGNRIFTINDLKKQLESRKPGERVSLTIFRQIGTVNSETFDVTVVLLEDK